MSFLGASLSEQEVVIVTELCAGGSLWRAIKTGKVTWYRRGLKIAIDVARGLDFLHRQAPGVFQQHALVGGCEWAPATQPAAFCLDTSALLLPCRRGILHMDIKSPVGPAGGGGCPCCTSPFLLAHSLGCLLRLLPPAVSPATAYALGSPCLQNVLLTEHGRAKLADVGLARMVPATQSYLSGGSTPVGTFPWAVSRPAASSAGRRRQSSVPWAALAGAAWRLWPANPCSPCCPAGAGAADGAAVHHQGRHLWIREGGG